MCRMDGLLRKCPGQAPPKRHTSTSATINTPERPGTGASCMFRPKQSIIMAVITELFCGRNTARGNTYEWRRLRHRSGTSRDGRTQRRRPTPDDSRAPIPPGTTKTCARSIIAGQIQDAAAFASRPCLHRDQHVRGQLPLPPVSGTKCQQRLWMHKGRSTVSEESNGSLHDGLGPDTEFARIQRSDGSTDAETLFPRPHSAARLAFQCRLHHLTRSTREAGRPRGRPGRIGSARRHRSTSKTPVHKTVAQPARQKILYCRSRLGLGGRHLVGESQRVRLLVLPTSNAAVAASLKPAAIVLPSTAVTVGGSESSSLPPATVKSQLRISPKIVTARAVRLSADTARARISLPS